MLPLQLSAQKEKKKRKNHILALPTISRSIETDWSFGAAGSYTFHINSKDSAARTSNLQMLGNYSLRKQVLFTADATVYFPKEKYILNTHLSYSYFPDKFWGVGNKTPESNEEKYTFRQYYIYLHGQRSIARRVFGGLIYEFQKVNKLDYIHSGLFDRQNIAGRKGYTISGLGASFSFDKRSHAFWPDRGGLLLLSFNHFDKIIGSSYRYTNFVLDTRRYWRLTRTSVLAAQAYGFFNTGADIPIRSLASLGGSSKMRGYYDGRYKDKNLLVLQTEFRLPVWRRFGIAAFGSMGDVNNKLAEISLADFKFSYGGGIRFALNKREKMNLRFDYGIGQGKQKGFYIQFGEAF